MRLDKALKRGERLHADQLTNRAAITEQHQGRQATHPELPGQRLLGIRIDLDDRQRTEEFIGERIDDRGKRAARRAPRRPEINQNRLIV